MKQKGFTLIELMIVVAILGIVLAVVIPLMDKKQPREKVGAEVVTTKYGNVSVECISGYKHTVSDSGTKQLLNERGGGVACR